MLYYPPLLDYLKWIFAIAAVVCLFRMMPEDAGRKRGLLHLAGFVLAGLGTITAGTVGVLFNRNAPRIQATGVIAGVVLHTGRGSSTRFHLSAAPAVDLSFNSAVPAVRNGETATIVYQEGSGAVLGLTILSGSDAHFQYAEADHMFNSVFAVLGGIGMVAFGVVQWLADPTAQPPALPADTQEMPGEIDSASLLHLNGSGEGES